MAVYCVDEGAAEQGRTRESDTHMDHTSTIASGADPSPYSIFLVIIFSRRRRRRE